MKNKFFAILLVVGFTAFTVYALAQEEGADFWAEDSTEASVTPSDSTSSEVEGNTNGVKPVKNSCSNRKELREEARLLLRPFKYNMAKTTMVTMKRYPQKQNVIIPIYSKQAHRLVFSTKGLPQNIGIKVYDKHYSEKKRKVLFETDKNTPINTFELPEDYKEQYIFLEYNIPPTTEEDRSTTVKGCVIFMMGYLYLEDDTSEETVSTESNTK